jgi:hypothetical protein
MDSDPVLYRTFILPGRLNRSRPNRPDRPVDNRPIDQDRTRNLSEY